MSHYLETCTKVDDSFAKMVKTNWLFFQCYHQQSVSAVRAVFEVATSTGLISHVGK